MYMLARTLETNTNKYIPNYTNIFDSLGSFGSSYSSFPNQLGDEYKPIIENVIKTGFFRGTSYIPYVLDCNVVRRHDFSKLIDEVREYLKLSDNWDGYGGCRPKVAVIETAIQFLETLKETHVSLPKSMLAGDGEVSIFWKKDDLYIEIGFDDENQYSYLINHKNQAFGKDDCDFSQKLIDLDLLSYI